MVPLFTDKEYTKAGNNYPWRCTICDCRWEATWNNINTLKSGCPSCGKVQRWTKARIVQYVLDNKLEIVPKFNNFQGVKFKHQWKCLKCGHKFVKEWDHMLHQKIACQCASLNKTELLVKNFLEKVFETKFTKIRPDWLRSPLTGSKLELDLFSENLKLAIEVNGRHHHVDIPYFYSRNKELFKKVKQIDRFKAKAVRAHGIQFVAIKITAPHFSKNRIKADILAAFKKAKVELPARAQTLEIT